MAKKHFIVFEQKLALKPVAAIAMFLPFVYWATGNVLQYSDQPISTQTNIIKVDIKQEFPELTFCMEYPFFEFYLMLATGDETKYANFYEALKGLQNLVYP